MHNLLNEIAITVIAATLAGLLCHFIRQPIILGYVIAGVAIGGNFGLGLVEDPHTVEVISELGLILLLYIIGLEINLRELVSSGRQLLVTAIGQFPLCVGFGFLFFSIFTVSYVTGSLELLYLSLLCALSSTAIVVKGLYDKGEIDTLPGRMTIGTLVFQDIYAILLLAIQPNLADPKIAPILMALASTVALLAVGFLLSKFILSRLFKSIAMSPEMVVSVSLGWCAMMAGLADVLNVSREMGALVAGLAISAFPYSIHITAKTLPLRDFFLTLFFVSLGMKLTLPSGPILGPVLLISAFVFLSRFITIYPILSVLGAGRRAAFVTSLNLSQVSEFSLVISSIGLSLGHLTKDFVSLLVLTMVLMSLVSSYSIRFSHEIFIFVNRLVSLIRPEKELRPSLEESIDDHEIIFVGYHRGARALVSSLESLSPELLSRILVIDFNPITLAELKQKGIKSIFGDIGSLDTLAHAHVSNAKIVLSTIPDLLLKGTNNKALVQMIRGMAPRACIVCTADDQVHQADLMKSGADLAVVPYELIGEWLAPLVEQALKNTGKGRGSIGDATFGKFLVNSR